MVTFLIVYYKYTVRNRLKEVQRYLNWYVLKPLFVTSVKRLSNKFFLWWKIANLYFHVYHSFSVFLSHNGEPIPSIMPDNVSQVKGITKCSGKKMG
jgi:hypothetical protein